MLMLCNILGIKPQDELKAEQISADEVEALIAERTAAKKAKDFARADAIRDELNSKGVVIEDTRAGVRWSYK